MNKIKSSQKSVRLPKHILPIHYKIKIAPDLMSSTFSGEEDITIEIKKETNKVILHSQNIDIETAKILSKNKNSEHFVNKITYDVKNETATLHFKKQIKKGKYTLSIIFSGLIKDNLRGLYKSKYILGNKEKFIATTQFEATDARRAFPCFDEPDMKAIFEVSLIVPDNHEAISNTLPINIEKHQNGYKIVSFSPTPIMSTYLLAFISGEFEYIKGKTKDGIEVRVFTTEGKKHKANFALDIAIKSLEFFNKYFDIPYPMPNLDLIAIPDFESAAMENWGAITFRESSLLVDEEHTSLTNKQWIAITIVHEIAHQWFGNLVTMHWWTDLWLNEGFASYMEYMAIDKIFPNWNIWSLFVAGGRYKAAMDIDSLLDTHPIEVDVHHPDEINEAFDMVSYEKGCAIIRMLADYLGEETFQNGVICYLKKHSLKNTKTIDLWDSFEKVSKKPVKKIMHSWTSQGGFPIIEMQKSGKYLSLSQERFFANRLSKKANRKKNKWQIPLIYSINNKTDKILLNNKNIKIKDTGITKINKDETSFLRVKYNSSKIELIKEQIKENHLNAIDRVGIIRDMSTLSSGGYIKTSEFLDFVKIFENETEYIVWFEIASGINKIYKLIEDKDINKNYEKFALSLFSPLVQKIGFEKNKNESHHDTMLRELAIREASMFGDKDTIKKIKGIFDNRIFKPINNDIKRVVYDSIAEYGNEKDWKILKGMYKDTNISEEKDRLGRAFGSFRNTKIIEKVLEFALSKDVRTQDSPFIIASLWNNKYARDTVWQFIQKNWKNILDRYGENRFMSIMLDFLGGHIDRKTLVEAKKFFKKNRAQGAEKTLLRAYEKIEANIAWINDDMKDIKNWLDEKY